MALPKRILSRLRWALLPGMLAFLGCAAVPDLVDHQLNSVYDSADTQDIAPVDRNLLIADLHADTMMWDRPFLRSVGLGHVDLPRLARANVALQMFTAVTNTPSEVTRRDAVGGEFDCVPRDGLNTTGVLSVVQIRPVRTWWDLEERAMYQARRLKKIVAESRGPKAAADGLPEMRLIEKIEDLRTVLVSRRPGFRGRRLIGVVLGLEGVHWLGENGLSDAQRRTGVRRLYDAGFRMLALTHRFDNGLAGSSEGCSFAQKGLGLSDAGGAVLTEAARLPGMVIDLAHASEQTIDDAYKVLRAKKLVQPVLVSHSGIRKHCQDPCNARRNLDMASIDRITEIGGVIGVGFWPEAVGRGVSSILMTMESLFDQLRQSGKVRDVCEHVAFGSDFDGAVSTPFDVSGLPRLVAAMRTRAFEEPCFRQENINKITGANVCRVLAVRLDPRISAQKARALCDNR